MIRRHSFRVVKLNCIFDLRFASNHNHYILKFSPLTGCFIVHWAGCGDQTHNLPIKQVHILHFENMYGERWRTGPGEWIQTNEQGNNSDVIPSKMMQTCDPSLYDWKSPLPSFI